MNQLKILSHGQVTDLSSGFSLGGGKGFSIFLKPKQATMLLNITVNCRCVNDNSFSVLPCPLNDWTPALIQSIGVNAIDLTEYDVYWGAHEQI